MIFQSTLPVWGATLALAFGTYKKWNFNPRSPCGERRHEATHKRIEKGISIHAPRVGSDYSCNFSTL